MTTFEGFKLEKLIFGSRVVFLKLNNFSSVEKSTTNIAKTRLQKRPKLRISNLLL